MVDDSERLATAWKDAAARLPQEWTLDSLRCASESLNPDDRSDDWIAVAAGPHGATQRSRASDPVAALAALVSVLTTSELAEDARR